MTIIRKTLEEILVSAPHQPELEQVADSEIDFSDIPELSRKDDKAGNNPSVATDNDRLSIYQDTQSLWRWRLVAANGEIIAAASQGFASRQSCIANIERVAKPFSRINTLLAE